MINKNAELESKRMENPEMEKHKNLFICLFNDTLLTA
jgi:hypothetical protein